MSLFINSKVHLPSSCEKCPFNFADMSVGICTAADKTIDTRTYGRKRHPDCPLIEIPTPHGRLIDADELYEQFINEFCNRNCDESVRGEICDRCGVLRAINMIKSTPTIIEAEVSEE